MARLKQGPRLLRFIHDIGVLISRLVSNAFVYSDEAVVESRVRGEWMARAALLLGLARRLAIYDTRRRNHVAMYRSHVAPRVAEVLSGLEPHERGAALIVASAVCPRTPVYEAIAPLLGARPQGFLGRYVLELARNRVMWVCSFIPCNTLGGVEAEKSLQPVAGRRVSKEGLIRVIYTLDTRLLPVTLLAGAGIAVPHRDGGLALLGEGPRWAARYPSLLYQDHNTPSIVVDAVKAAGTSFDEAISALVSTGEPVLEAAARAANILCG